MKKMKFQVYSDPGHGWIRVRRSLLITLGIQSEITQFSYQRGPYVYLEEDQDATTFVRACKAAGIEPEFSTRYCRNRQSAIRTYSRYVIDSADEYESAAEWCARRGILGKPGDRLPDGLSVVALDEINGDPDSFERRVREYAYAVAMESTTDGG